MATRKLHKRKLNVYTAGRQPTRRYRRHKNSTAGKVMPPLDVRSDKQLADFKKRITKGPLTIILVYADWCGHCHTMMPHFDGAAKSPERSIQAVKIKDEMLPSVNTYVENSINKRAKPINVSGYPSIIVVNNKGEQVTEIEPVRDTAAMAKVMNKSGVLATDAGLNSGVPVPNNVNSTLPPTNMNVGEEELKGSIGANKAENATSMTGTRNKKPLKVKTANAKNLAIQNAREPSILINENVNTAVPININPPSKNIKREAEEITSMTAPVAPPIISGDIDSISNSLSPAQRVSGGSSLFGALSRASWALATPAALIGAAAFVTSGKKSRKSRKIKKHHTQRRSR